MNDVDLLQALVNELPAEREALHRLLVAKEQAELDLATIALLLDGDQVPAHDWLPERVSMLIKRPKLQAAVLRAKRRRP